MKSLLFYLKNYKKETILAPFFKMTEAIFELLIPLVVASIIDKGIKKGDTAHIMGMCLLMILLGIIGLVSAITAQYFSAKAAVGFSRELRGDFYKKVQYLSFSQIDKLGTSSIITRITSDINQVQTGVNMVLRLFLRSPFIVFGAMIMAFTIDFKSALVFTVVIPLLSIIVFTIMLISIPLYKKVQDRLDTVLKLTRENINGSRVIRALNLEDEEYKKFSNESDMLTKFQNKVGQISVLMNPFTFIVVNGGIIMLIYTGALRVNEGIITQGAVVALYNYMSQILIELVKLANLIITITRSIASGERIQNILKECIDSDRGGKEFNCPISRANVVEIENMTFAYENTGEAALSNIDLEIKRGEIIGIIGGTGSGKTTLLNLICGHYAPVAGEIRVCGKIRQVLQKSVLFKGTIKDNLKWGKSDADENDMMESMKKAQALNIIDNNISNLEMIINQGGSNLSGGQRQRIAIARGLISESDILILDDSSSALDYMTDKRLRDEINKKNKNKTIIISAQRTSSVRSADKIVVLEDGRISDIGNHDELLNRSQVYKEIYDSQFGGGENV